jgi:uncharacterized protein
LKNGYTALIIAAAEGHTKVVKMLIDKGANVNLQDNEGMTALIWGCKADSQVANALLDAGADIHLCDEVKTN